MSFLRIHFAVSNSADLVELTELVNKEPQGLREKDVNGKLPLHIATELNVAKDIIFLLIDKYNHAIMVADNNCMLPSHHLAKFCTDMDIYTAMGSRYPDCFKQKDQDGWLPIHYAARDNGSVAVLQYLASLYAGGLCVRTLHSSLPLHCAAHNNTSLAVLEFLIAQYPEGLLEKGKQGMLPIHYAARSSSSLAVIQLLSTSHTKSLFVQDHAGRLPAHYSTRNNTHSVQMMRYFVSVCPEVVKVADQNGWLCLHYAARFNNNANLIDYLIAVYPAALSCKDKEDWLPVHHAAMGAASVGGVMKLVEAFPLSVLVKAGAARKFCHELAPTGSEKQAVLMSFYYAFQESNDKPLSSTNIATGEYSVLRVHLLGDSLAGKSVLSRQLQSSQMSPTVSGSWYDYFELESAPQIDLQKGRTYGIDTAHVVTTYDKNANSAFSKAMNNVNDSNISLAPSTEAKTEQRHFIIYDYAGKYLFHSLLLYQMEFFAKVDISDHLFVLIVPTYDIENEINFPPHAVKNKMMYWLKLMMTACTLQSKYVSIMVNTFTSITKVTAESDEIKDLCGLLLREIKRHFKVQLLSQNSSSADSSSSYDFILLDEVPIVDVRSKYQIQSVIENIHKHYSNITSQTYRSNHLSQYCVSLLAKIKFSIDMNFEDYESLVLSSIQSFFSQYSDVREIMKGIIENSSRGLEKDIGEFLLNIMMKNMAGTDKVRYVNGTNRAESMIVTNVKAFLCNVCGDFMFHLYSSVHDSYLSIPMLNPNFNTVINSDFNRFVLPVSSIVKMSAEYNSEVYDIVKLLTGMRFCVPVISADASAMKGIDNMDIFFDSRTHSGDNNFSLFFPSLIDIPSDNSKDNSNNRDDNVVSIHSTLQAMLSADPTVNYETITRYYLLADPQKSLFPSYYVSMLLFYSLYMLYGVDGGELVRCYHDAFLIVSKDRELIIALLPYGAGSNNNIGFCLSVYSKLGSSEKDAYETLSEVEDQLLFNEVSGVKLTSYINTNHVRADANAFSIVVSDTKNGDGEDKLMPTSILEEQWLLGDSINEDRSSLKACLFGYSRISGRNSSINASAEVKCLDKDRNSDTYDSNRILHLQSDNNKDIASSEWFMEDIMRVILASNVIAGASNSFNMESKSSLSSNSSTSNLVKSLIIACIRANSLSTIHCAIVDGNITTRGLSINLLEEIYSNIISSALAKEQLLCSSSSSTTATLSAYPVALPILIKSPTTAQKSSISDYRVAFLCSICAARGKGGRNYCLSTMDMLHEDILRALSVSLSVLEALLNAKSSANSYFVIDLCSSLQDTLDYLLNYAIIHTPQQHSEDKQKLELFCDRGRLQKLQSSIIQAMKTYLSLHKNANVASTSTHSVNKYALNTFKGYSSPKVSYTAKYMRSIRRLFVVLNDEHLLYTGLQLVTHDGVTALICDAEVNTSNGEVVKETMDNNLAQGSDRSSFSGSVYSTSSTTNSSNSNITSNSFSVLTGSCFCREQFIRRGSDALAYHVDL